MVFSDKLAFRHDRNGPTRLSISTRSINPLADRNSARCRGGSELWLCLTESHYDGTTQRMLMAIASSIHEAWISVRLEVEPRFQARRRFCDYNILINDQHIEYHFDCDDGSSR